MYLTAIILYLSSAFVLGPFYAFIPLAIFLFILIFRCVDGEKVLIGGLPGYENYLKKVKYRILPYVW
jgi:protein-S-isoprenylcysteine O-methyltransferase Ste14